MLDEAPIRVLLVEDDDRLGGLTAEYLESHGVRVTRRHDGVAGLAAATADRHDVLVLDVMLPGRSGIEVCREVRRRLDVPIIMLTALGEEADRVIGLEAGADDYVIKPFSVRELLARIRAQARRSRGTVGPGRHDAIEIGRLRITRSNLGVELAGARIDVTAHEFALLFALAENAGRVMSREQLLERARGAADAAFDRAIDVQISRLRGKFGDVGRHMLKTIRGAGYMLVGVDEP